MFRSGFFDLSGNISGFARAKLRRAVNMKFILHIIRPSLPLSFCVDIVRKFLSHN